jgi:intracellular sulfur oxidation DsrE/DsrF family protein
MKEYRVLFHVDESSNSKWTLVLKNIEKELAFSGGAKSSNPGKEEPHPIYQYL